MHKMFNFKGLVVDKKAVLFCSINFLALIALCSLLYFNLANFFVGENDGERGRWRNNEGEWDPDFKQEEKEAVKIVICLLLLIVGCISLFVFAVFVWHETRGYKTKLSVGCFSALIFMFGQMMFLSYWYFSNFERRQMEGEGGQQRRYLNNENNNNNNQNENYNNNYNQAQEMTEEELLAYHQKVTSSVVIVMALMYSVLSIYMYEWAKKLPTAQSAASLSPQEKAGQIIVFQQVWKFISTLSVVTLSFQLFRAFVQFFGEQGERMREEGLIYNMFMVVFWLLVLVSVVFLAGRKVMIKKEWTNGAGVGALIGR